MNLYKKIRAQARPLKRFLPERINLFCDHSFLCYVQKKRDGLLCRANEIETIALRGSTADYGFMPHHDDRAYNLGLTSSDLHAAFHQYRYGRDLKASYSLSPNIFLLDPIYDPDALYAVRARASVYLHGHSAGGTNPSLVEMMHFGVPVLAHGCSFNRHSTENKARYFESAAELAEQLRTLDPEDAGQIGDNMREIAQRKYTWDQIGEAYFELLDRA